MNIAMAGRGLPTVESHYGDERTIRGGGIPMRMTAGTLAERRCHSATEPIGIVTRARQARVMNPSGEARRATNGRARRKGGSGGVRAATRRPTRGGAQGRRLAKSVGLSGNLHLLGLCENSRVAFVHNIVQSKECYVMEITCRHARAERAVNYRSSSHSARVFPTTTGHFASARRNSNIEHAALRHHLALFAVRHFASPRRVPRARPPAVLRDRVLRAVLPTTTRATASAATPPQLGRAARERYVPPPFRSDCLVIEGLRLPLAVPAKPSDTDGPSHPSSSPLPRLRLPRLVLRPDSRRLPLPESDGREMHPP